MESRSENREKFLLKDIIQIKPQKQCDFELKRKLLSNKCINETIMRSDGVSFINHQANLIELNDEFLKNTVYLGQITDEELLNMLDKIREFLIN